MSAESRFGVLDGWRGLSILLVLACHLLPLGPKAMQLNVSTGILGMAIFFTLSGFLVTHFLLHRDGIVDFLIRRFFRILPLAWLYIFIALLAYPATREVWLAHLLFYANFPPKPFVPHVTEHLWSLCVEMHFYLGIALLVTLFKKRGLLLLPILAIGFTLVRVTYGMEYQSVITQFKIDEILSGATLALIYEGRLGEGLKKLVSGASFWGVMILLLISSSPFGGALNYFRPYLAALLVGITIFNPQTRVSQFLNNRVLFYIASISYALYVIHPLLASTWLGSGDVLHKYMKRPLLFAVTFLLAHISTFYFEHKMITAGKSISKVMLKVQSKLPYMH